MLATVILTASFLVILVVAVVKGRRMNKEQSALTMHPSNFEKPEIENVQKFPPEEPGKES